MKLKSIALILMTVALPALSLIHILRMPSVVFAISSICRMATPKRMPLMPATRVRRILSEMICESILLTLVADVYKRQVDQHLRIKI